jgi:hypothetical protein
VTEKNKKNLLKFLTGCGVIAGISVVISVVLLGIYYLIMPGQFANFEWSAAFPSLLMILVNWSPIILVGGLLWMIKGPRKTFKILGIGLLVILGLGLLVFGTCMFSLQGFYA